MFLLQDKFSGIEYVQTFQELKLRWEQNQEYAQQARGGAGEDSGLATEDANEYSYFEKDSDGEEEAEGGKEAAEQERHKEFLRQSELLLSKRPREEEEGDLMSLAKKRPAKTNGKQAGITLSISRQS
jgi:hypothetical protein